MTTVQSNSQKITPFLWFDNNAEEATNFYTSIFKNSKIEEIRRYGDVGPNASNVITCSFILEGQKFMAMNAGPHFKFSEAISFFVNCESQEEVDYFWNKLTADGGEESQCGWLKDKFGLSWQIIPKILGELLGHSDPDKAGKAMQAMLKMKKIDIAKLEEAIGE
ncbi:MAG TPA: VOC family protein [Saprospiraceae bacterium]|nr:VOC family protein [Saprospiraceae bacterium]